jgi:hypothetical protein
LLSVAERVGQSVQVSANSLQELRGEVQTLRGDIQSVRDAPQPGPAAPQPPPEQTPPPVQSGRGAAIMAAVLAALSALSSLGAIAVGAVLWQKQQQQQASLVQITATSQELTRAVAKLGEQAPAAPPPAAAAPGSTASKPAGSEGEPTSAAKARVLLPNLVGLHLAEARTAVAPLQLQLLPTDKKLKEKSLIGWQSPNPGAEVEPEEAVTVSLRPPIPKKKKR